MSKDTVKKYEAGGNYILTQCLSPCEFFNYGVTFAWVNLFGSMFFLGKVRSDVHPRIINLKQIPK